MRIVRGPPIVFVSWRTRRQFGGTIGKTNSIAPEMLYEDGREGNDDALDRAILVGCAGQVAEIVIPGGEIGRAHV